VESAHRLIGWLVAAAALAVAVIAVIGWARPPLRRHLLDWAVLAAIALVALDALVGAVVVLSGARPADGLHFLYAALALAILPAARFWGGRARGPRASLLAIAGMVLLGFTLRLFQTGG
jgi:heme A synthase